jgi:hypothetical protein
MKKRKAAKQKPTRQGPSQSRKKSPSVAAQPSPHPGALPEDPDMERYRQSIERRSPRQTREQLRKNLLSLQADIEATGQSAAGIKTFLKKLPSLFRRDGTPK